MTADSTHTTVERPAVSDHIVSTPGVCGGKPRINGHRIRVQDIVLCHERGGLTPDEIVIRYRQLTLGQVYAALSYYHDHRDEIWAQIHEGERYADEQKAKSGPGLLERLRQMKS